MKKPIVLLAFIAIAFASKAQIGIGTTTPNSTLHVNGSHATAIRIFTAAYTADITDCNLIFTGTSATTVTVPTAVGITGRIYTIKNASTNTSALTVATTLSQTIDGATSQVLSSQYQTITIISNGTNWNIVGYALPSGSATNWSQGGNAVSGVTTLGTTTAFALPFITNNVERMRITSDGNVGIGTSTFSAAGSTERLNIASSGTNTVIFAKGDVNDFLQLNVQNTNNGNFASSDIVATANNGSNSSVYVDMGINSQGYSSGNSSILNGSNLAYLYATGSDFCIGNGAQNKDLIFFINTAATGADGQERMRITSTKVTVRNDLFPEYNNNFSLGSATLKWTAVYATNGTIQTSDRRLKTNIADLNYGLKEILRMQPVRYNWTANPGSENKIGLIAQDVKLLVPEVVVGDETKENIGMNYAELVPVLINAIKEQQAQLEILKKKVEALENK